MNGHVDGQGRALITISIRASDASSTHAFDAWIDAGFNGDLVLPQQQIDEFSLSPSGTVKARLADGSEVALQRFICLIEWFGVTKELDVVANEGAYPLLGVGLLVGHDLHISYRSWSVAIN